jgi:hypothetical protein
MAAGALITQTRIRELAYRQNGGIHVTLLWQETEDSLFVLVLDESAGTIQRVAAKRQNALDVFNHPFAYA